MISVITPLHAPGNAYISATYQTLLAQTMQEWEWIILENNGGRVPSEIIKDPRVRVKQSEGQGIGSLKWEASLLASNPYILELDADDLLHERALEETLRGFFMHGADFVYSDSAQFRDGTWENTWQGYPYSAHAGWTHYRVEYQGHELIAMRAPPVTSQNLRYIYWAPDHLRAWRKTAYEELGGHDVTMAVADDHDLMVRFFLAGKKFYHIEQCLYFYRVHPKNTVATRNAEIQDATQGVYNKYVFKLAEAFADRTILPLSGWQLHKIDLCGGINPPPGFTPMDLNTSLEHQGGIACDLEKMWPLAEGTVGVIRANDAVEHLRNPIHTMNEAWRVLAPGGWFLIDVPSTNGKGAWCDPTHVSFWNDLSFRYYTDPGMAKYIPAFKGRFQLSRVLEWFPSEWHRQNNVPYVQAHLIALKPGYEPMGNCWR